jgi:RNA polymerase sigma factor (sigma-70 family)
MEIEKLEDVLLIISFKAEDEKSALDSFNLLYKEYSKLLMAIVKKNLKDMGIYDEQLLNSVINNVFFKLYEKPLSFSVPKNANNDSCFKSWLSVVALNELKSLLKQYLSNETSLNLVDTDNIIESIDVPEEILESINSKLLIEALNTLSQRDREILLTLYLYYEEGKKTPTEVLNQIARLHNTTKPNIRKIKERCEKKIIDFFSAKSALTTVKNGK